MRYGLDITAAGPWGRPDRIAELATLAERSGWDGVFCEDYICFPGEGTDPVDTYDVWITLALVAQATTRVTLGTMVTPVPRRRPWVLASQALTVDHLSSGRLVLGVGLGDPEPRNFASFGEVTDLAERAGMLDEALDIVARLWTGQRVSFEGRHYRIHDAQLRPRPVAVPRVPIWVGGALTLARPRRRALRWDGACLYRIPTQHGWEDVTPEDVRRLRADVDARPGGGAGYVIAVGGRERSLDDPEADREYVAALADAGADWWHEYVPPRLSYDEARRRIESGPVRAEPA
ncbi:MAG TPA: LLM class flavin-dependent oxidoreductase [Nocardioidaceae bacterium]|jgi:alkanesulfonate monooxygenase SsuD/methylene tetrahydromethanopterin reductase-like flavin-dependent oxidoreductase (luciferase family)